MTSLSERCRIVLAKVEEAYDKGHRMYIGNVGEGRQLVALQKRGLIEWDASWQGWRATLLGVQTLSALRTDSVTTPKDGGQ